MMDGEGSVTWITVEYDAGNREWEARCEGRIFRYPPGLLCVGVHGGAEGAT